MMLLMLAATTAAPGDKPADPNKKICRKVAQTGSLFAPRVCRTRAEWEASEAATKSDADRLRDTMQRGDNRAN